MTTIRHAYDIAIRPVQPNPAKPGSFDGWCFGLPPGITPAQWPLDPVSGYPLMHGFTLRLPEDYRCHGPDIVGLSFFATAPDQNDGGARDDTARNAAVLGQGPRPAEEALQPFWDHARNAHPRLYRFNDILDYGYALILLTETELTGPWCQPPTLLAHAGTNPQFRPEWLDKGSAAVFFPGEETANVPLTEQYYYKQLGGVPERRLDWARALEITPRAADPNAGLAPVELYSEEPAENGYRNHYYWLDGKIVTENYREHDWAKGHENNHIGGTMRPVQGVPEGMGPYYIGFEEELGGYNFGGGGNAQLDFENMRFDWACG